MPSRNKTKGNKGTSTVAKRVTVKSTIVQPAKVAPNKAKKQVRQSLQLSPCAWRFAKTVFDPFMSPAGACVPSVPNMQTRKYKTINVGVFTNGAYNGFIAVNPFAGCVNDLAFARVTNSAYGGTSFALDGVNPTGTINVFSNSPYGTASFTSQTGSTRLVACGIRVKYSGTVMNRAGMVFAIQNRNHTSLDGLSSPQIGVMPNALVTVTTDNEWVNVVYTPNDPTDFDFYLPQNRGASGNLGQLGLIGILLEGMGAAGNGSFLYEIHGHYETNLRADPGLTSSESDPVGLSSVSNIIANQQIDGYTGYLDTGRLWNNLSALASHDLTRFVAGGVMNMGMRYLTQRSPRTIAGGPVISEM